MSLPVVSIVPGPPVPSVVVIVSARCREHELYEFRCAPGELLERMRRVREKHASSPCDKSLEVHWYIEIVPPRAS